MVAVFLFIASVSVPISFEASGGILVPGVPETDGPAVSWELRTGVEVAENWTVFAAVPFWKLSNFLPSSVPPEFVEYEQYNWHDSYSESRIGFQLGVRRNLGSFCLEAAAGSVKRTASFTDQWCDCDEGTTYEENRFLGSVGVVLPAGGHSLLNLGVRTEDFNHWFFSAGVGLAISFGSFPGTETGGE